MTIVDDAADSEPYGGDGSHDSRNYQEHYKEVHCPILDRPRRYCVPDRGHYKCQAEAVDEGVSDVAPRNEFVTGSILRSYTDKFIIEIFPSPRTLDLPNFAQAVFAAVQHTLKVERLFAGRIRYRNINQNG